MRLSWFSNAPWANTGYGTQTKLTVPRLRADGHDVAIIANHGLAGAPQQWHGIPIYPEGLSGHSEDVMLAHHTDWLRDQPGWLLTLYDVWPLARIAGHEKARIASWVPVDHEPVSPEVLDWFGAHDDKGRFQTNGHVAIAMSKFGQREFAKIGVDARYVPHAIDTSIFRPGPSSLRAELQVPPDAFLIAINAANKGATPVRKAWSEMLSAVAVLMDAHPDVYLFLHTQLVGIGPGAPSLDVMVAAMGLPRERVRIVDQYQYIAGLVTDANVASLYAASDVLLATSMGEGFGIPVIEAQAVGTPVIVTDFSAQPELVGAGWRVGYQRWFDHYQGSFVATPLVSEIVQALEAAYAAKGDAALRARATAFAQDYDIGRVYPAYWRPVLAEMEAALAPPTLTRQQRRAAKRKAA